MSKRKELRNRSKSELVKMLIDTQQERDRALLMTNVLQANGNQITDDYERGLVSSWELYVKIGETKFAPFYDAIIRLISCVNSICVEIASEPYGLPHQVIKDQLQSLTELIGIADVADGELCAFLVDMESAITGMDFCYDLRRLLRQALNGKRSTYQELRDLARQQPGIAQHADIYDKLKSRDRKSNTAMHLEVYESMTELLKQKNIRTQEQAAIALMHQNEKFGNYEIGSLIVYYGKGRKIANPNS